MRVHKEITDQIHTLGPQLRQPLLRRWHEVRSKVDKDEQQKLLASFQQELTIATRQWQASLKQCSNITYTQELPVIQKKSEIISAIQNNSVVIISGATGSGKTTQIPKFCLELERIRYGIIGHTQPRRLAARMVAQRLAEELQVRLGSVVGYQVRFRAQVTDQTLIKVMTDGILLAEIRHNKKLMQYGTLIIDEAHERNLNIDFILGYLKQLIQQRPELKIVITSATLDATRFSQYFNQAPVISVSGQSYPVEVRYRSVAEQTGSMLQEQVIIDAVNELRKEPLGDILIFMSSEREIRETAELMYQQAWSDTEVVPLFSRLSIKEQERIFQKHTGSRIVLATNVAESSLTVPGITYVIDTGKARISRYNYRTKVQQLLIEPISQASAEQRKGRCGRLAPGICIRLYSEQDFCLRPQYNDPEILRTNLAVVILQMVANQLGDLQKFPFLDAPQKSSIKDGWRLLHELGAILQIDAQKTVLTPIGRQLANIPIEPRLARMILAAKSYGCVRELLIITSALSIQDPRERPSNDITSADQYHKRFYDPRSDFLTWLKLWDHLQLKKQQSSATAFYKQCRQEHLNPQRIREWRDLYTQLYQVVKLLGFNINQKPADYRGIHCALLSGLLSHIGKKDPKKKLFNGARNLKFTIFPGSVLFKKLPHWVVAAELVETSRLWGRTVATIDPDWLEPLANHLIKRSYGEPYWDQQIGAAMVHEKLTLYGLPIVIARKTSYARIDQQLARRLFIQHALVDGEWQAKHNFCLHNKKMYAQVELLEQKTRRHDLFSAPKVVFDFYNERLPLDIVSTYQFNHWWQQHCRSQPNLFNFPANFLLTDEACTINKDDYPDLWEYDDILLPLSYNFSPGEPTDGVTVHIALPLLPKLQAEPFFWQVPGLRITLITTLLKLLPKKLRRCLAPLSTYVSKLLQEIMPFRQSILKELSEALHKIAAITVPIDAWDWEQCPEYLKMNFAIIDCGSILAQSRDLQSLQKKFHQIVTQYLHSTNHTLPQLGQEHLQKWNFGTLPQQIEQRHENYTIMCYPALVDQHKAVAIRLFSSVHEQQESMFHGIVRLLQLDLNQVISKIQQNLECHTKLSLVAGQQALPIIDDSVKAVLQKLVKQQGSLVWDQGSFERLRHQIKEQLKKLLLIVLKDVSILIDLYANIKKCLQRVTRIDMQNAKIDINQQLNILIYPYFICASGIERLGDLKRYLQAMQYRLEKLAQKLVWDQQQQLKVNAVTSFYEKQLAKITDPSLIEQFKQVPWMIEELRVSLFAQHLGTKYPISEKRIYRFLTNLH